MDKNRGYAVVEACLVVPVFLFFMLALGSLAMSFLAEAHIHQSLAEAADDTALYCYLENKMPSGADTGFLMDITILTKQFHSYLGADPFVRLAVKGKEAGIIISIKPDLKNKKIFTACADFWVGYKLPLFGRQYVHTTVQIKKKAFVGYEPGENTERYVYVTPNEAVYHLHRGCSYLSVSVRQIRETQKSGYAPCSFCGRQEADAGKIYVARTGDVYHNRADCSGLKRTVRRIALTEAAGLRPCQRCGKE